MNYFDDKFQNSPNLPLLPFYYSCDTYHLGTVLETRILNTMRDANFNEKQLFLSYGRPIFRQPKPEIFTLNGFKPAFFVFTGNSIENIQHILPFESATFFNYNKYINPRSLVSNFKMTPQLSSLSKLIDFFYGSNENFFRNHPKENVFHDPLDFEIESYHNLLKKQAQLSEFAPITPEISLHQDIPINKNTLQAVILPVELAVSRKIQEAIANECKAQVVPYNTYGALAPDYVNQILQLTRPQLGSSVKLDEINTELIRYLAAHPNKLYEVDPRKYEVLVAELLRDMGYDTFLTPQTVDGGRDIIAASKSPSQGTIITLVECKRYSRERPVGIDIVKQFLWTLREQDRANIGLIVTTSSFSEAARKIEGSNKWLLNLHDFDRLKEWLTNYGKWQKSTHSGGLWLPKNPLEI